MKDADEFYKSIERKMTLKSSGKIESGFWQTVGKSMSAGEAKYGQMFSDMLGNIERMMTGQKKHGYQQNKKSEKDKLIEKGKQE